MSIDLQKNRRDILTAYDDVLNDKSSTDWVLFGYEGQTNVLKLAGSGDGGLEELSDDLHSSKVMYAVIRVCDPKTTRTKYVLINWTGEAAPNIRKGICAGHLHDVRGLLKGINVTINARTEEEVEADQVFAALAKATATSYDFSDRSEQPERNNPVGTNYQRTNPLAEINTNSRNKFWEQQEQEEHTRKSEEMARKKHESEQMEIERKRREVESSTMREAVIHERSKRILAGKQATERAEEKLRGVGAGNRAALDQQEQQQEEMERSRRADNMRKERKQEAESIIGHSTKSTRSMFEARDTTPPPQGRGGETGARPPPRKLKEFTPINCSAAHHNGESVSQEQFSNSAAANINRINTSNINSSNDRTSNNISSSNLTSTNNLASSNRTSSSNITSTDRTSNATSPARSISSTSRTSNSKGAVSRSWPPPSNSTGVALEEKEVRKAPQTMFPEEESAERLHHNAAPELHNGASRRQDPIGGNATTLQQPTSLPSATQELRAPPATASTSLATRPLPQVPSAEASIHDDSQVYETVNVCDNRVPLSGQPQVQSYVQPHVQPPVQSQANVQSQHRQQQSHHIYEDDSISMDSNGAAIAQNSVLRSKEIVREEVNIRESNSHVQTISQQKEQYFKEMFQDDKVSKEAYEQQSRQIPKSHQLHSAINGSSAATSSTDQLISSRSNNSQAHLYDHVPVDYEHGGGYDSPVDGHTSPETATVGVTSPGPASPHVESTPSVAMTYEVDGIEYQLLPEHGLCARALYDYQASDDTEISFDPSEIVSNIEQIDEGWWQGVGPNGDFGLFPANYVELINAAGAGPA